jgi:hypothetical protein
MINRPSSASASTLVAAVASGGRSASPSTAFSSFSSLLEASATDSSIRLHHHFPIVLPSPQENVLTVLLKVRKAKRPGQATLAWPGRHFGEGLRRPRKTGGVCA